ncbi:MAG: SDR family oxidoreductase [Methanotrichaceae archaeon]|jgi:NAD(P)-dependent dehydrogenase (short-subunit alcohol dehydrogenase family)
MNGTMEGRTVLVTGSTDGIGKATALGLARMGARVMLHGRDQEKGRRVLEEITRTTGSDQLDLFIADLSSQKQIRKLAADVVERHERLNVLINNAGTFQFERSLTEESLETTFAVNYLAPFLLTHELLKLLEESKPSRIVNVASITHRSASIDWSNLQGERHYNGHDAYALSKLCVIIFTYALSERLEGTGVTANCLHPGVIKTKLLREGFGDYPGDTPENGARTSIYLASSPEMEGVSSKYFENRRPARSSDISYNRMIQKRLWKISVELTGLDQFDI